MFVMYGLMMIDMGMLVETRRIVGMTVDVSVCLASWTSRLVGAGARAAVGQPGWFVPSTQGKRP